MTRKKILIIGAGFVGEAVGKVFLNKNHNVIFTDINPQVITKLRSQNLPVLHPQEITDQIFDFDFLFFCIQTPTKKGKVDLSYLLKGIKYYAKFISRSKKYQVCIIKSTVPPETTEKKLIPLLEKFSQKTAGKDFGICVNPEFLREKSAYEDFLNPKVTLIGKYDDVSARKLKELYKNFSAPLYIVSAKEAEMAKYIHNIFNALKISYFNEFRRISKVAGVDPELIYPIVAQSAEGMWNPEYGTQNKGPFEGSCLVKDLGAFNGWLKQKKINSKLIKDIYQINEVFSIKRG